MNLCRMHEKADVEITTKDDVVVVVFNSASISAVHDLEDISKKMLDYISENCPGKIVVDFQRVKFFSSQTLGLLLHIWRKLKGYGGQVVISGINPNLNRVFKITNLDKIFDFYPDAKTAVEAICGTRTSITGRAGKCRS